MGTSRRDMIGGSAALTAGVDRGTPAGAAATGGMVLPALEFALSARVDIGPAIELGRVDGVRRRVIPIIGGSFTGPTIGGRVLAGGADWQSVRDDGTADILARYTLVADDGTAIAIVNPGYRHGPADVLARLAQGGDVDPAAYYFRTAPRFEVADGPHAWLGRHVFVGTAARYATHVVLDVYRLT